MRHNVANFGAYQLKIKFTQWVVDGETVYKAGDIHDLPEKQAKKYIKADEAFELKEVADGGQDSTQIL